MIERPIQRSKRVRSIDIDVKKLAEIALRIDNISSETIHAIEVAETPDEKANAIHAAVAEAMNARAAEKTE